MGQRKLEASGGFGSGRWWYLLVAEAQLGEFHAVYTRS